MPAPCVSLVRSLVSLAIFASLAACGQPGDTSEPGSSLASGKADGDFASTYGSVSVRGTMNGWGTTPMRLVADNEWAVELETGDAPEPAFKFDVYGDWRLNFGDDDGDNVADQNGRNIPLPQDQRVVIHFNDLSRFYWVEEKTYAAEVEIVPPPGFDRSLFQLQRIELTVDGEPWGWSYLYVDDEHERPYAPLSGLRQGTTVRATFDRLVAGTRLVGETAFVVEATEETTTVELPLQAAALSGHGIVRVRTVADRWEDGRMVSSVYGDVGIFLGEWQAQALLGHTDANGYGEVMAPAGVQKLSAMTMTSSHSMTSAAVMVTVPDGGSTDVTIHLAPVWVSVRAHFDAGWGYALYVTGASEYLGGWQKAYRMEWSQYYGCWIFERNLPLGLPFKVVLAPWSDAAEISTAGVRWEQGPDHVVTPPSGYYASVIDLYPTF